MIRLIFLCLTALVAFPVSAADWLRAESDNYVVHAQLEEAEMRELAVLIEDFRRMLEGQLPPRTTPGRKAQIFLDENGRRISRVSDFRNIGFAFSSPEIVGAFVVYDPSEKPVFRYWSVFYGQSVNYFDNAFFPASSALDQDRHPQLLFYHICR